MTAGVRLQTGLRETLLGRRSQSRLNSTTPSHAELLPLVAAASRVPDHGRLLPWRLIELRGKAREQLGLALAEATGLQGKEAAKLAAKPLRAELLIALVASRKPSVKVPVWEQDAAAAGAAHALVLLLEEAGWGVIWRTGSQVRSQPVRELHRLGPDEELLGWLYVGGTAEKRAPTGATDATSTERSAAEPRKPAATAESLISILNS